MRKNLKIGTYTKTRIFDPNTQKYAKVNSAHFSGNIIVRKSTVTCALFMYLQKNVRECNYHRVSGRLPIIHSRMNPKHRNSKTRRIHFTRCDVGTLILIEFARRV